MLSRSHLVLAVGLGALLITGAHPAIAKVHHHKPIKARPARRTIVPATWDGPLPLEALDKLSIRAPSCRFYPSSTTKTVDGTIANDCSSFAVTSVLLRFGLADKSSGEIVVNQIVERCVYISPGQTGIFAVDFTVPSRTNQDSDSYVYGIYIVGATGYRVR